MIIKTRIGKINLLDKKKEKAKLISPIDINNQLSSYIGQVEDDLDKLSIDEEVGIYRIVEHYINYAHIKNKIEKNKLDKKSKKSAKTSLKTYDRKIESLRKQLSKLPSYDDNIRNLLNQLSIACQNGSYIIPKKDGDDLNKTCILRNITKAYEEIKKGTGDLLESEYLFFSYDLYKDDIGVEDNIALTHNITEINYEGPQFGYQIESMLNYIKNQSKKNNTKRSNRI